jgi:hypothetical protein
MGTPLASFPEGIWDGDTDNIDRVGRSNEPMPDSRDWDRVVSEVIATQTVAASHTATVAAAQAAADAAQALVDTHNTLFRVPYLSLLTWEKNQKAATNSLGGGLTNLALHTTLNTGNTINVSKNPSKLLFVVHAAETLGTMTITGNRYSSLTGNVTANYTEDIIVTANTTDNSANTANNGTMKWDMTNAYVSNEIYFGDVVVSTTDIVASDIDVYSVWYFQNPQITKMTFDALALSAIPTNNAAALDIIVYSMDTVRAAKTLNIIPAAHVEVNGILPVVNPDGIYALQRVGFTGESDTAGYDGIFTDVTFYPSSQTYWESVMLSIWTSFYFPQTPTFG